MAERCPYCGSFDVKSTGLGYAEKTIEGITAGTLSIAGKLGRAMKGQGDPAFYSIGGALDRVLSGSATKITEMIPTQRKCNKCGKTFHSSPDKGWNF